MALDSRLFGLFQRVFGNHNLTRRRPHRLQRLSRPPIVELLESRRMLSAEPIVALTSGPTNQLPVATPDIFSVDQGRTLAPVQGVTSIQVTSDAADWMGQGASYNFTPVNSKIVATRFRNTVDFSVYIDHTWWQFTFASPDPGTPLAVGAYEHVGRFPLMPGVVLPSMYVHGGGRGADNLRGRFVVNEIAFAADGTLLRASITFEQHALVQYGQPVEGQNPALRGTVKYNATTSANVLNNDTDPDGDRLRAILVYKPLHGALNLNPDGRFQYTPDAEFHGTDTFAYKVNDGVADSNVTTVSLIVNPVNHAPVGISKSVTTTVNRPYTFSLHDFGFSDPGDTPANRFSAIKIASLPAHGRLTKDGMAISAGSYVTVAELAVGSLVFTPAQDEFGVGYSSIQFQVKDDGRTERGGTDTDPTPKQITLNVDAAPASPIAVSDHYLVDKNQELVSPLANNRILIWSDPGEFIGHGQSYEFLPSNTDTYGFLLYTNDTPAASGIEIHFTQGSSSWGIIMRAPAGDQPLSVGTYYDVTYAAEDSRAPGLNVYGPSGSTQNISGSFTIKELQVSPSGRILKFSASFEQHTNNATAALYGLIEYNHEVVPSLTSNDQVVGALPLTAEIVSNPAHGALTLNPDGSFIYTPTTDFVGPDSFTYRVYDGTTNSNVASVSILVRDTNRAPRGLPTAVTVYDDTTYTFRVNDFAFSDSSNSPANSLLSVKIASIPTIGRFTLDGRIINAGDTISAADIAAGKLKYSPQVGGSGPNYDHLTFLVQDDEGTVNGGVDTDSIAREMTINVRPPNRAPHGTSNTVTMLEDRHYYFTLADFGFSDPDDTPANGFKAVKIASLPVTGTLIFKGTPVTVPTTILASDIYNKSLRYIPAANGTASASFQFQVQDHGGTAAGGVDTDPTKRRMTISITPVNDAPQGVSKTVVTLEDNPYDFTPADFGFTDLHDSPANQFRAVKINSLPASGTLMFQGMPITSPKRILVSEIGGHSLRYVPAANRTGAVVANFLFQVQDNGGTANGGRDTDLSNRRMTISIAAVNDAPQGISKTVSTLEDKPYVFKVSDFGFHDSLDIPANDFLSVRITSIPTEGTLVDHGQVLAPGLSVSVRDIQAGWLKFVPTADKSGAALANFEFQVQDSGGTAHGGSNTDLINRRMTVSVIPVNDPPQGTSNTVTVLEDRHYYFSLADFGFTDPVDAPGNHIFAVKIDSLPATGLLMLKATPITSPITILASDIYNKSFRYIPAVNQIGVDSARFQFRVQDNGGTANGGVNIDSTWRLMTIDIVPVNDAPVGISKILTIPQNHPYTFATADFGFSDPNDLPGNSLLGITIPSLPMFGTLTYRSATITSSTSIAAGDIQAGLLRFVPATNSIELTSTRFSFRVQDDGGRANHGVDVDLTPKWITLAFA